MRGMALSLVVFLPALGAVIVGLLPRGDRDETVKRAVLAVALLTFLVSLPLYTGFDARVADYQFQERRPWMPSLGITYHVGIDGISLLLVLLTTFLMMGKRGGLATVLVLSGVTRPDDPRIDTLAPDHVVRSVADLLS